MPRIRLPADAPKMLATPNTAPTSPSASPRRSAGTAVPISAVAMGRMPPPPIAWMAREAISMPKLPTSWERPHSSEPMPNRAIESR